MKAHEATDIKGKKSSFFFSKTQSLFLSQDVHAFCLYISTV